MNLRKLRLIMRKQKQKRSFWNVYLKASHTRSAKQKSEKDENSKREEFNDEIKKLKNKILEISKKKGLFEEERDVALVRKFEKL